MITAFDQRQVTGMMLALALGLLVGIQRQWSQRKLPGGTRFAGVRTFGLLGLAGGIAGLLYQSAAGPAVVLLGAAAALVVIGYRRSSTDAKHISGTASVVGLITLAGGFLAGWGERLIATAIVVAMVLLLAMRSSLHRWIDRLNEREVLAIARFAVIAMVILPLLPDRGMGPYNAWNPRQLWLVVVLVSGFRPGLPISGIVPCPPKPVIPSAIWSSRGVLKPRLIPPFTVSESVAFQTAYARGESLPPNIL